MDGTFAYGYTVPDGAPICEERYSYTGVAGVSLGARLRGRWSAGETAVLRAGWLAERRAKSAWASASSRMRLRLMILRWFLVFRVAPGRHRPQDG